MSMAKSATRLLQKHADAAWKLSRICIYEGHLDEKKGFPLYATNNAQSLIPHRRFFIAMISSILGHHFLMEALQFTIRQIRVCKLRYLSYTSLLEFLSHAVCQPLWR